MGVHQLAENWEKKDLSQSLKVGIITSKSVLIAFEEAERPMPNRYEREIEEILRNLEHTEPGTARKQRTGERVRRSPGPRVRQRRSASLNFSLSEWLLIIAIVTALGAGGYAFTLRSAGPGGILTPLLAAVSVVCLFLVALSHYLFRPRSPRSVRFGNTTVMPLRRNFFSNIKTRWHLFMLKMRYRGKTKQ